MSEKPFAALSPSPRSLFLYSWACFFLFLFSLFALSNLELSLVVRLWIELFGLVVPFILGLFFSIKTRPSVTMIERDLSFPKTWFLFFLLVLLATHFYRLSSLPSWPLSDESVFTSLALDPTVPGNGSFVRSGWQMEPMLLWALSFFFKVVPPSLLGLRLFTVLWSLAAAVAAYAATRTIGDRATAFVFALLFSFSFWALGLSRQCTPNDLIPFFELAALGLAGLYVKFPEKRWPIVTALGLVAGFGFYTYVNWIAIWAGLLWVLLAFDLRREYPKVFLFLLLSLGLASPWMFDRLSAHSYLQANFLNPVYWPACFLDHFRGLFWDGSASFPLGPARGGYFDPVTGALIGVGALSAFQKLPRKYLFLLFAGILLGFAPGVLTNNLELQRLTPVLPLFILLALFGLQTLLASLKKMTALAGWSAALLVLLVLNWAQLAGPYNDFQSGSARRHWRSRDYFEAYRILRTQNGPGYVFNEWNADDYDSTLGLACDPFNAITHPNLPHPGWIAFLTDADYGPELGKRFPHLQLYPLNPTAGPDHLLRLFIAPVSDFSPAVLKDWLSADAEARQTAQNILRHDPITPFSPLAGRFASLAQRYAQDPFLASAFWERSASFFLIDQDYAGATACFAQALKADPTVPHLKHNWELARALAKP